MLELRQLTKHFGGIRAVDGIDLTVQRGEILGLIGPNGSGKSTTVNLICGLFPLTRGQVIFEGSDVSKWPTHARVSTGISRTFQNIRLFTQLTVWQNLWVAQNSRSQRKHNLIGRWFGGSNNGLASLEEYDRERAHVRSLHRLLIGKGCPPLDIERELAATDAEISQHR